MIRKLLTVLLLTGLAITVRAQEPDPGFEPELIPEAPTRNFRLGVRTGGAISTLSSGNLVNPSLSFGLTGAMTARFKFGKIHDDKPEAYRFGFESQLGVTYKGSNFKNQNTEYYKISLFYGDLSAYGMMKLTKDGRVKLLAGPYASYLLTSSIYIKPDTYRDTTELTIKPFDFGIGYGLEFKTNPMGFQVLIKQGLQDINDGLNPVNYPHIRPLFNGGPIRNFSVELVLSF